MHHGPRDLSKTSKRRRRVWRVLSVLGLWVTSVLAAFVLVAGLPGDPLAAAAAGLPGVSAADIVAQRARLRMPPTVSAAWTWLLGQRVRPASPRCGTVRGAVKPGERRTFGPHDAVERVAGPGASARGELRVDDAAAPGSVVSAFIRKGRVWRACAMHVGAPHARSSHGASSHGEAARVHVARLAGAAPRTVFGLPSAWQLAPEPRAPRGMAYVADHPSGAQRLLSVAPAQTVWRWGAVALAWGDASGLGWSTSHGAPVGDVLFGDGGRVWATLSLMAPALGLAMLAAWLLGAAGALRGGAWRRVARGWSAVAAGVPTVVTAALLGAFLAAVAHGSPSVRYVGALLTLVLTFGGVWVRHVLVSVEGAQDLPHIAHAARWGHGPLRQAWWAVRAGARGPLAVVALSAPALIGGAMISETVFAWPGMGRLLMDAVRAGDTVLAAVVVVLTSGALLLATVLVDAHRTADTHAAHLQSAPRVRGTRAAFAVLGVLCVGAAWHAFAPGTAAVLTPAAMWRAGAARALGVAAAVCVVCLPAAGASVRLACTPRGRVWLGVLSDALLLVPVLPLLVFTAAYAPRALGMWPVALTCGGVIALLWRSRAAGWRALAGAGVALGIVLFVLTAGGGLAAASVWLVALLSLPRVVRVALAETDRVTRAPFVRAARLDGLSPARIFGLHVWPHARPQLAVLIGTAAAQAMGLDAALSFMGIDAGADGWGSGIRSWLQTGGSGAMGLYAVVSLTAAAWSFFVGIRALMRRV